MSEVERSITEHLPKHSSFLLVGSLVYFFLSRFFYFQTISLEDPQKDVGRRKNARDREKKHFQQFLFDAERLIATMSFQTISLSAQFVFSTCVCVCV